MGRHTWRPLAALAADLVLCAALWPELRASVCGVARLGRWVDGSGVDDVAWHVAAAGLWCASAWLAIGLGAALIAPAPGVIGSLAAGLARSALPRIALRAVVGAAGVGVTLAPAASFAASPPMVAGGPAQAVTAGPPPAVPLSAPPAPAVAPPALPLTRGGPATALPDPCHAVRAGETLWGIATTRLAPSGATPGRVARFVAVLHRRNATLIGPDPDLIRPGQCLELPLEPS